MSLVRLDGFLETIFDVRNESNQNLEHLEMIRVQYELIRKRIENKKQPKHIEEIDFPEMAEDIDTLLFILNQSIERTAYKLNEHCEKIIQIEESGE